MKSRFSRFLTLSLLAISILLMSLSQSSCSRKSGCPAEDVQAKTDSNGIPKASKPSSGLLPPKAYKKSKKE